MGSEIAIDVLAAKMGMDPFDIRELNCYKESAQSTIPTGYKPDVYCLEEMYKPSCAVPSRGMNGVNMYFSPAVRLRPSPLPP